MLQFSAPTWAAPGDIEGAGRALVLEAVSRYGLALQFVPPVLREDRDVVLAAVANDASALAFAADHLRADREVVLAAVQQNGSSVEIADVALRRSPEVLAAALSSAKGSPLRYLGDLTGDRRTVLAAVKQRWWALRHASAELTADHEVVLAACAQDALAIEYAAETLAEDRDFVVKLLRVLDWRAAREYAAPRLRADPVLVLAAVEQDWSALPYTISASDTSTDARRVLLEDRAILSAAVRQNGQMLELAAPALRSDRELVLAALRSDVDALQFAGSDLRQDLAVVAAAVARDRKALKHAGKNATFLKEVTALADCARMLPCLLPRSLRWPLVQLIREWLVLDLRERERGK